MRHFIFLTQEGSTKTPKDVDIENLQVLGFADGSDEKEALKNFIKESAYLKHAGYKEVIIMELVSENQSFFPIIPPRQNQASQ